jgi:hypothetical protein
MYLTIARGCCKPATWTVAVRACSSPRAGLRSARIIGGFESGRHGGSIASRRQLWLQGGSMGPRSTPSFPRSGNESWATGLTPAPNRPLGSRELNTNCTALSLITSRSVNGNTVRNFPIHRQLSAAQGSLTKNCLSTLTLPFELFETSAL